VIALAEAALPAGSRRRPGRGYAWLAMDDATALLVTVTGRDRPGLTSGLCDALEETHARILDIEQVTIRDRLVLGFLIALGTDEERTREALERRARELDVAVEFEPMPARGSAGDPDRHYVTILGQPLRPGALAALTGVIAAAGGNIDRIVRLSRYPILSFELLVSGGDAEQLRRELIAEAPRQHVDVAVQRATLYRRAKRLIVLDVDSTLLQGEFIEQLGARVGSAGRVAELTSRAMAGELDYAASLRERVALLEGLPATVLDEVRDTVELTPGARTLVRTLKRLGFVTGIVSGGFTHVTEELRQRLGIDFAHANRLEVHDGRLTGRLVGPVVDRQAKAAWLEDIARACDVPLGQTVAVGDGANDMAMLERAGLGIAFNAKPVVRAVADTAVSVPYLDAILFLLGITREEIEAADAEDPEFEPPPRIPIPE
jgi:phosphoserine phosphatase